MTEVARRETKVPVAFGVPLHSLDEAYRLAQNLSLAQMLPKDLRGKPSDVLAILLYGQELGLGPMQSIQSIYVVNGRPTMSAQMWRALARRAGHLVRLTERQPGQSATVEVVRADDPQHPHRETYTLDMAKTAKLAGKDVWQQHADDMLAARATARACRFACPEVALGFYTEDEVDTLPADGPVAEVEPVLQPEPAPRNDEAIDAELVQLNAAVAGEPNDAQLQAFALGGES